MPDSSFEQQARDRVAGFAMIGATLLVVFAMAHHPTHLYDSTSARGDLVHGAMLILLTVLAFGFAHFALRCGIRRALILAGVVAYAVSVVCHLGAATINGFVVPALAASDGLTHGDSVFAFSWAANQALARIGVYATGAAYLAWSIDFVRQNDVGSRLTGGIGLVASIAPVVALFAFGLSITVHHGLWIYALHMTFALLVGIALVRGRVR